jgi:catechol 2,3-dioxygenase-like lactoylglutathione lyase family enzyme
MVQLHDVPAVVLFSDRPRALADWYKRALAVREVVTSDAFIGLSAGAVTLFVQKTSEGHRPGRGGIRPHFRVADCRAAHDELVAAGATTILGVSDVGAELVAAVADPDGNPLGLIQPTRPRR